MSMKISPNPINAVANVGDHLEGADSRECVYDGIVTKVLDLNTYEIDSHGWRHVVTGQWLLTPLPTAPNAPHLTFDEAGDRYEQGKGPQRDVVPCVCWEAGYGEDVTGLTREQVQHPAEYDEGAQAAFEKAHDL